MFINQRKVIHSSKFTFDTDRGTPKANAIVAGLKRVSFEVLDSSSKEQKRTPSSSWGIRTKWWSHHIGAGSLTWVKWTTWGGPENDCICFTMPEGNFLRMGFELFNNHVLCVPSKQNRILEWSPWDTCNYLVPARYLSHTHELIYLYTQVISHTHKIYVFHVHCIVISCTQVCVQLDSN